MAGEGVGHEPRQGLDPLQAQLRLGEPRGGRDLGCGEAVEERAEIGLGDPADAGLDALVIGLKAIGQGARLTL